MTYALLWAMLIAFSIAAPLEFAVALTLRSLGFTFAPWMWIGSVSLFMAGVYGIEVSRALPVETNLPVVLFGALLWVVTMGIALPIDLLRRLRQWGAERGIIAGITQRINNEIV